ncbi:MAG: hypothetical protein IBJ09_14360 [Bacteroidia bacterium]|nr:hypothetical protein [Bacteroidia bacterium]
MNPSIPHILAAVPASALLVFFILRKKALHIPGLSAGASAAVFMLKVALLFVFWAIYTYVYANPQYADIYKYFYDGEALFHYLRQDTAGFFRVFLGMENESDHLYMNAHTLHWYKPFEEFPINENRLIIRFHALLYPLSGGSYFAHAVLSSFLAYLGGLLLYKTWLPLFREKAPLWFLTVFALPSVLFWSAGALKEPFVLLGGGLLVYALFRPGKLWYLLPALLLILFSKEYVFAAFLPGVLAVLLGRTPAFREKPATAQILALALVFALIVVVSASVPGYNFWQILYKKQEAFVNVSRLMHARSRFPMPAFSPDVPGILAALPHALFNALFRPFPQDIHSLMIAASFLEMLALYGLGIYSLFTVRFQRPDVAKARVFWFCLSFVLLLSAIIGLTVDNSGALVRYRMPALPFLMAIFVLVLRKNITFKWFKI